jgi:hypothetical protein
VRKEDLHTQPLKSRRILVLALCGCVAAGLAFPVAFAGTSPTSESNGVASGSIGTYPGSTKAGKQVFVQFCGKCHTMAAAGTSGTLGPNLDHDKVNFTRVVTAVYEGIGGVQAEYKLQHTCSASLGPRCLTFTELYNVAKFVVTASR